MDHRLDLINYQKTPSDHLYFIHPTKAPAEAPLGTITISNNYIIVPNVFHVPNRWSMMDWTGGMIEQ